jgi:hypothetical protein
MRELKAELNCLYGELGNLEEERMIAREMGDDNWISALSSKIENIVLEIVNIEKALGNELPLAA